MASDLVDAILNNRSVTNLPDLLSVHGVWIDFPKAKPKAYVIDAIDVGPVVEQVSGHVRLLVLGGPDHGGPAAVVQGVDLRFAVCDQQVAAFQVPGLRRMVQTSHAWKGRSECFDSYKNRRWPQARSQVLRFGGAKHLRAWFLLYVRNKFFWAFGGTLFSNTPRGYGPGWSQDPSLNE